MKKLNLIAYIVVACVMFAGCNDLLDDPSPATSLPGEQVLTTADGVEGLRASLYSTMRGSGAYSTTYFIGPSAIADESRGRPGSSRMQGLNTINSNDGGTGGLSSYGATYNLIQNTNLMIGAVEDGVLEDQATLDRYRGEAYAIRALAMHHLVRALGYEPGMEMDGWDLGIAIITDPTLDIADVGPVPRSTNAEVYNQILSDLGNAKTLLAGTTDDTRINEAFVDGLTARVNLYAGNWGDADAAAADAIANSGKSLEDTPDGVAGMFDETAGDHPEALFKIVVNPNTEAIAGSNVNSGLAAFTAEQWAAQIPTDFLLDLYDPDDYRIGSYQFDGTGDPIMDDSRGHQEYEGGWFAPCYDDTQDEGISGCESVNADTLEIQKWNGEKGSLADDIPYMRLSEMYLIRAEAAAKDANDYTQGLPYLNQLREARGLDPLVPATDIGSLAELEDEILDERVRELAFEGHRFWDLKRLGRDIPNPDGTTKIRYDSYRILDNIGEGNISANPELVENPGY